MPTAHACAESDIPKVGPHWTVTQLSRKAKAARGCGALGNERKGYTEPFEVGTMRGKGDALELCSGGPASSSELGRWGKTLG